MPTLNWIGKEAVVNHHKEVPFRLLKPDPKLSVGDPNGNLLIEGDNLEALKALLPYYAGRVKCIYIDPPYNTGNERWVYSDNVNSSQIRAWLGKVVGTEGQDLSRHDKWLCMMMPRLKLLHELLREDGIILVSIDDNEMHHLQPLMDEVFGESNHIETFIWKSRLGKGATAQKTAKLHEYVVCYAKNHSRIDFKTDKRVRSREARERLRQWGQGDRREDRPTMYYPIFSEEYGEVYPKRSDGTDGRWRISKEKMEELIRDGMVTFVKQEDGRVEAYRLIVSGSETSTAYSSILDPEIVKTTAHGSIELKRIFGRQVFDYPKPSSLLKELISLNTYNDKGAIILDSFAGSGTTGHAVLQLNKEDGGNRRFILVELEERISRTVTTERLRKVIKGYTWTDQRGGKHKEPGLGGDFQYCTLGETIFRQDGAINSKVKWQELARHIWFTETYTSWLGRPSAHNKEQAPTWLGNYNGTGYYLYFNGIGGNVFGQKELKDLPHNDTAKVIYADRMAISRAKASQHRITFKQIPYDVKEK